MIKAQVLSFFVLAVASICAGQDRSASCPQLYLTDSVGPISIDEIATFQATVETGEIQKQNLEYIWSTNGGEIIGGQGTAAIEVRRSEQSLTVSVEVKGFPTGCPNTASALVPYCPPLRPIQIAQVGRLGFRINEIDLSEVIQTMNDNPNDQLFVYFSYSQPSARSTDFRLERQLINYLASKIGGAERITIARQFGGLSLVQFWRVPPGAENPSCDKCDTSSCPTITITGPAGISPPGEAMEFTAEVSGDVPTNARYRWRLAGDGQILKGQGTLRLRVQTPNKCSYDITATLEILGLNNDCPTYASASAPVASDCISFLIDEFARLPLREQAGRIDSAMRERSKTKVLFIQYFVKGTSKRTMDRRVRWLTGQMRRLKLSPAEFEIVTSESFDGHPRTKIYFVPPGASNPEP